MSRNKTSMKHYSSYSGNRESGYYKYRGSSIDEYLKERLLKRKPVAKDGSCLFRAVGEQAWLTQATHWKLRRHCANHIKKRKDYFKSFLTIPVEEYCHKLSSQVVWGGEIELVALSQMLERDIIVYKEEESKVTPQEFNAGNSTEPPILLAYTGKNHYDIVWKEETERSHGFCQSIVYDVLMDKVFREGLEKPLHQRMKNLTRFALSENYNPSCQELKQRYPPDLLHCWAGRIYENTALAIAEAERQEREVSDRRMAVRLQTQHLHVGHPCDVLYKGVWYEGEIAHYHKPSQTAEVCIYHMGNGVYEIPFKDMVLTGSSTKYSRSGTDVTNRSERADRTERSDLRSESRSYSSRTRQDGRRKARSPSPSTPSDEDPQEPHIPKEPMTYAKRLEPPAAATQSNKVSQPRPKPHPHDMPKPHPGGEVKSQPSEVPQPPSDVHKPHPSKVPKLQPNKVPEPHSNKVPELHPNKVPEPHPNEIRKQHPETKPHPKVPSEVPKPHPIDVPESSTEVNKSSSDVPRPTEKTGRRKKKSRRNNEANKQVADAGTTITTANTTTTPAATGTTTSAATTTAPISLPYSPPTVGTATSTVYATPTTVEESYSVHMDAFSEAPECEWPILHASSEASRYSGAPGSFIDGPPNDDEDQLPVPFIFNNPGDMLMRELDPPVHLLIDDSLETRLHFMVEFAQKCLGIYAKYVRDPKREELFSNLCNMKFDEFMLHRSQASATSSNMSRAESEESVTHRNVPNTAVVADAEDQAKIPDDIIADNAEDDGDQEKKVSDKTLSTEEEKFLAEFQHSYGDTSPMPEADATPIITEPITEPITDEDRPLVGGDMANDVLPEAENYDGVPYGAVPNPVFQPNQNMMPPAMMYPQPYHVWPHPFPYPPFFMPIHPMMMQAMPPYYQGPHPPLEDHMKEPTFEEVEDDQLPSGSSSDTASPSINSQTELTESANEKERDMPESDSILLDKGLPNDIEKGISTDKLSETQIMEDSKVGVRSQHSNQKFYRYNNYPQNNRGGYQRYFLSNPPRPPPQQPWYDNNRGGFNRRRRTREHENK